MGGISVTQLIIIAVIILLLFGTKKLRNVGGDLGAAVKGFKKAMSDEPKDTKEDNKVLEETTAAKTDVSKETKKDKEQA
ncbi:twin-arginine translocase TatA/TatE family subunit [Moritella viscosa]|uniref:Sec-independent protein translocase protein TatA n=1 Tax=Moritella viscosa TaxID=80854 RepID=A0A1L0B811_9GAMM|nr:twin-arginine translocase TatA/TatE family subunit [Moritella viscosa]SGY93647.1 Sec-independent protein translocase protein tatA/E homolog [Moritella viscosa]SGY98401.1 Sec-independent protein translocase protein tatA/E homolog [Moritella viscosa]SGY98799.1 Sec-independent protein translocase protein tatA/E homolog [Moritella viscosa]SGZ04802.1 Sec-independent protein translocase protein tatA/E homolog [Moritella viscosa]SGZ04948.1 Sec-independent protein translocase protein tatA/E homolog